MERQLFSASQHARHGFLHQGIRSDGLRGESRRKGERDVIREQDRENEVTEESEERKDGRKKSQLETKRGEQKRREANRDRETVGAENHLALS